MKFRPCIDIHNGKVKQIVGGSLKDAGDQAKENFVAEQDAAFYAKLYKKAGLKGGAPILGSAKCVVKAHGNSDAKAFASAIRQARDYAASGIIEKVSAAVAQMQAEKKAEENADA